MRLKLTSAGRPAVALDVADNATIGALRALAASSFGLANGAALFAGYPPALLDASDDAPLTTAGVRAGSLINVRGGATEPSPLLVPAAPSAASPPPLPLPIGAAAPSPPPLPSTSPLSDSAEWACAACTLLNAPTAKSCGVCGTGRELEVQPVPADNSCLYTACGYLLDGVTGASGDGSLPLPTAGRRMDRAPALRSAAAAHILSHADAFTGAVLGRPPLEHAAFVNRRDTWGGGVELRALAEAHATELAVADIRTRRVAVFGEEAGFARRAYLLYDGVHYDALHRRDAGGMVTLFAPGDAVAEAQALEGEARHR